MLFKTTFSFSQINPLGIDNTFIGLDRENGFFIMSGVALASYFLSIKANENDKVEYYQLHVAYFNGDGYDVFMQNFGIEREYSKWFSTRVEANLQEFSKANYSTFGFGVKVYTRWSLLREKRVKPFFEYGAGAFGALKKFPENGSRFTFNLTYAIGLEYLLSNKNKLRIDYNFIHHSNASLADANPGFDGNGISLSYSWFLE